MTSNAPRQGVVIGHRSLTAEDLVTLGMDLVDVAVLEAPDAAAGDTD